MSHELFYTSAPSGLKPGSQGFCTVAMTRGLPATLVERLEALSAYRPASSSREARASHNPAVRGHYRLVWNSRPISVLSYVCAAGLDYTQRHNKFAHHVVLEANELPVGGPAWLLQQPGFLATQWDGQVKLLPAGRTPPQGDQPPKVCREWERITGDAGWAGVLAGGFLDDPSRPAYLLYPPGLDPLPLLEEAVALLPAEKRWEVTFSTYFTGLPQGVRCAWRCVLADSPEAAEAARLPGALILNLTEPLGQAPDGELTAPARTGRLAGGWARATAPRSTLEPSPPRRAAAPLAASVRELPPEEDPDHAAADGPGRHSHSPAPPPLPGNPRRPPRPPKPVRSRMLAGMLLGLGLCLPLVGVAFAVGRSLPRDADPTAQSAPGSGESPAEKLSKGLQLRDDAASRAKAEDGEAQILILADEFRSAGMPGLAGLIKQVVDLRKRDVEVSEKKINDLHKELADKSKENDKLTADVKKLEAENKRAAERNKLALRVVEFQKQLLVLPENVTEEFFQGHKALCKKAVGLADQLKNNADDVRAVQTNLAQLEEEFKKLAKPPSKPMPKPEEKKTEPEELKDARKFVDGYLKKRKNKMELEAQENLRSAVDRLTKVKNAHPEWSEAALELALKLLDALKKPE